MSRFHDAYTEAGETRIGCQNSRQQIWSLKFENSRFKFQSSLFFCSCALSVHPLFFSGPLFFSPFPFFSFSFSSPFPFDHIKWIFLPLKKLMAFVSLGTFGHPVVQKQANWSCPSEPSIHRSKSAKMLLRPSFQFPTSPSCANHPVEPS